MIEIRAARSFRKRNEFQNGTQATLVKALGCRGSSGDDVFSNHHVGPNIEIELFVLVPG